MSTRGTFRICEEITENQFDVNTYYIHCDCYPKGAINHIAKIEKFKDFLESEYYNGYRPEMQVKKKRYAALFEIAIDQAEKTIDHDFHGDTEYKYNLFFNKKGLNFIECYSNDGCIFSGTWKQFLKKYLD